MKPSKILRWTVISSVTLLAACGGVSDIGKGDGTPGGGASGGMHTGSGASNGKAGAGMVGSGMQPGGMEPGGMEPGGGAPMTECSRDADCELSDPLCAMCADGSYVCPKTFCAAGKCVESRGSCRVKCETSMDCPVRDLACTKCDDGSAACPAAECVMGQCQDTFPGCGTIDPCEGQPCGAECKSCGPAGDCAPSVASYCSAEGKCQPGLPQCAMPGLCKTEMDCGTPPPECVPCGNETCAAFSCIEGKCVFSCPPAPEPQCKTTDDCPAMDAVCKPCPDGQCAIQACITASCELVCPLK